jgi:t-SNARE complex subunit (syntaxin)
MLWTFQPLTLKSIYAIPVLKLITRILDRIDENMDDTLSNVEGAQGQLHKYLTRISSNRWLIIKIFIVLLVLLLIFIVFVA